MSGNAGPDGFDSAGLVELCRRHHVRTLDVFGSGFTERFDPSRSDLDFVVNFQPLPFGGMAEAYLGLQNDLGVLFQCPIDLLTERSIENPFLRKAVESSKRRVFPPS